MVYKQSFQWELLTQTKHQKKALSPRLLSPGWAVGPRDICLSQQHKHHIFKQFLVILLNTLRIHIAVCEHF